MVPGATSSHNHSSPSVSAAASAPATDSPRIKGIASAALPTGSKSVKRDLDFKATSRSKKVVSWEEYPHGLSREQILNLNKTRAAHRGDRECVATILHMKRESIDCLTWLVENPFSPMFYPDKNKTKYLFDYDSDAVHSSSEDLTTPHDFRKQIIKIASEQVFDQKFKDLCQNAVSIWENTLKEFNLGWLNYYETRANFYLAALDPGVEKSFYYEEFRAFYKYLKEDDPNAHLYHLVFLKEFIKWKLDVQEMVTGLGAFLIRGITNPYTYNSFTKGDTPTVDDVRQLLRAIGKLSSSQINALGLEGYNYFGAACAFENTMLHIELEPKANALLEDYYQRDPEKYPLVLSTMDLLKLVRAVLPIKATKIARTFALINVDSFYVRGDLSFALKALKCDSLDGVGKLLDEANVHGDLKD